MNFLILLILAIVQGLTEFLPVSSSGHLVLMYNIFGVECDTRALSILLHLATLLSVLWHYRKDIIMLVSHPLCPTNRKIIVTTISTCIIVLIIKPIIDVSFGGAFISTFFMITAILLFVSDIISDRNRRRLRIANITNTNLDILDIPVNYKQAIVIGLSQGIACIPGISRSGTTIAVSKLAGVDEVSAKYSFLISIPIILGSMLLEIIDGGAFTGINIGYLLITFVICFAIGLLCIRLVDYITQRNKMYIFSFYLFFLSLFLICNSLFLHLF